MFTQGKKGSNQGSDEYFTPRIYWESIKELIPNETLWEAFYGDGSSAQHLRDLGFNVLEDTGDFFKVASKHKETIVSNAPFSKLYEVLKTLVDMPNKFILIIPIPKLAHRKVYSIMKKMNIQVIIPNHYTGFVVNSIQTRCPPVYMCYITRGLELDRDLVYL
tara:strand:+ start:1522 stop:2007 length:486 start_codon:yes stop_codon:yes gene_type:complete